MSLVVSRRSLLLGGCSTVSLSAVGTSAAPAAPNHRSEFPTLSGEAASAHDVRAIQHLLIQAGVAQPTFYPTYTRAVFESVRTFQSRYGLAVTGRCDPSTLQRMCATVTAGNRSSAVTAMQTLLNKHGYRLSPSGTYDYQTNRDVRGLQAGHALPQRGSVDLATWKVLFSPVTSGPMYPMMQKDTGGAQWANCGPVSLCTVLLNEGKTPDKWTWWTPGRRPAIEDLRYDAMGVANTSSRNRRGTEYPELKRGLARYGLSSWSGGIGDTLSYARQGKSSIAGGDAYKLPWNRGGSSYVRGPVSHWVAVVGFDGSAYLVCDPITTPTNDIVQRVSEATLRAYAATNPGWYSGHPTMAPPWRNSVLVP